MQYEKILAAFMLFCFSFSGTLIAAERTQELLEHFATQFSEQGKVPGGAVAIFANERLQIKTFGQRGLDDKRAVDSTTVFRIASLSKGFAASLAALMVAEGQIAWESPVHKLLPKLRFATADTNRNLQFQHLLSQSTGVLPYAFDQQLETGGTLEKILPQYAKAPIICRPGACYGYQNSLFSMSALIMEKQSGRRYSALLQERIFTPLAMRNSSVGLAAFLAAGNVALPHVQKNKQWQQIAPNASYYAASPAAGINSSIADMGLWLAVQLGSRQDVMPESVLEALRKPRIRANKFRDSRAWQALLTDEHYGLGWRVLQVQDETILFHAGWVGGYSAQISYSPKHRVGMVILLNAERWLNSAAVEFWCAFLPKKTGRPLTCQPAP